MDSKAEIEEEIESAEREALHSYTAAMNSYGAGWDRGYVEGLKQALKLVGD